mmetsp:Transcript_1828/g.4303  ORF Transcript_1828/g.4303 Transcript_1828/m.4303 type:complete len:273 (+) Transcript_1828:399-1217(+)
MAARRRAFGAVASAARQPRLAAQRLGGARLLGAQRRVVSRRQRRPRLVAAAAGARRWRHRRLHGVRLFSPQHKAQPRVHQRLHHAVQVAEHVLLLADRRDERLPPDQKANLTPLLHHLRRLQLLVPLLRRLLHLPHCLPPRQGVSRGARGVAVELLDQPVGEDGAQRGDGLRRAHLHPPRALEPQLVELPAQVPLVPRLVRLCDFVQAAQHALAHLPDAAQIEAECVRGGGAAGDVAVARLRLRGAPVVAARADGADQPHASRRVDAEALRV